MARANPSLLAGLLLGGVILALALISLVYTPHDPARMAILARLSPPSTRFWLGTDPFGRDIASMLMVGARNALLIGCVSVGLGMVIGTALGLFAASRAGSLVDEVMMRLCDFLFAFPAILTVILIVSVFGPGFGKAMLAIGLFNIPIFARLAYKAGAQVLARDFIKAARLAGVTPARILLRHVLPNIAGLLMVQASIQCAGAILAEAGLSYLGLGVPPPNPSWGRMLNDAQTFLGIAPMLAVLPGVMIALSVLAFTLLGDGLRDALDPRGRA